MAQFGCGVGAGALEVIGGAIKGFVMWITSDCAGCISQWLTCLNTLDQRTLLKRPA